MARLLLIVLLLFVGAPVPSLAETNSDAELIAQYGGDPSGDDARPLGSDKPKPPESQDMSQIIWSVVISVAVVLLIILGIRLLVNRLN